MWNETEYEPICRCVYSEERSVDFVEHRFENLSHRLQRALKWEFSVDDDVTPEMAATLTRARFLRIPNIGSKSLNEVNEWLIMNNCKPLI